MGDGDHFYHCFPGAAQHAMMRRRPGIVTSSEPVTIPDQRCTASALHRIREMSFFFFFHPMESS
jgi:hypothetical protein